MNSAKSLLLACTAMGAALAVTLTVTPSLAATPDAPFAAGQTRTKDSALMFAQAPALTPAQIEEQKKKAAEDAKKKAAPPPPPAARPAPPPPPAARPAPPPPPAARPAPPPQAPAVRPATPPPPPPAVQQRPVAPPPPPPAVQQRPATPPPPPPAVQQRPAAPPPPPPAVQQRPAAPPPPPPAAQDKPAAPPVPPPAAQGTPPTPPAGAQDRRPGTPGDAQRPGGPRGPGAPGGPGAQGRPGAPAPAGVTPPPAASTVPPAPAGATSPPPAAGATPPPPAAGATPPAAQAPGAAPAPSAARTMAAPPALAAPPPPPATVRNANEFIRRGRGGPPSPGMADVRRTRQESRDGDRVIIREGDRTIVRNDNRTIIQHNESSRFAIGARAIRTETRGDQFVTVVERPGGVRISSYSDRDGRLTRRVRRDRNGRETVLIDNLFAGAIAGLFISALQPPVVRMPRETYIVDGYRADRRVLYDVFIAPPIDRLEQRYTLDQVRYNAPLREYMRRVDLDVNFETGSWQLTPQQIDRLAAVADGLNRAISQNPREIFLIEGHTDTVGNNDDNLSLSDRRAEAVAVALTERFQVPSENLVTQGYGEDYPKEQVDGPSRINRRVAVRRITPLLDQTAQQ